MKYFKRIIIVFLFILMSGCHNQETNITINANKSIDLDIKILSKKPIDENRYNANKDIYAKRNLNITRLSEENGNGYKITKHYDNIDDLSIETEVKVNLNDYFNEDFADKTFFKVEKGFLKNKYTADFTYKFDDSIENIELETADDFVEKIENIYTRTLEKYNETKTRLVLNNENSDLEFNSYIKYFAICDENGNVTSIDVSDGFYSFTKESITGIMATDILIDDVKTVPEENKNIKFIINLPSSVLSNNATNVSSNGKELEWIYKDNESLNIGFTFEIANKSNYYLLFGVVVLSVILLFLLVLMVVKLKNAKKSKLESSIPILTEYDPSIENIALNEKSNVVSSSHTNDIVEIVDEEENPLKPSKDLENEMMDIINSIEKEEKIIEIKDEE